MGRRRVKEKHVPMSLSMPYRLIMRVDSELSYRQSRSKWVQGAIREKLEREIDFGSIPTKKLLLLLVNRDIISEATFKAMLRSVETEEQQ